MRRVKETDAYWALFGWATTLLVRLSCRIGLKAIHGGKPKPWEQAMLDLLSKLAPRQAANTDSF